MADSGIVSRFRGNELHCNECIRVTIGTPEENIKFLEMLQTVYAELANQGNWLLCEYWTKKYEAKIKFFLLAKKERGTLEGVRNRFNKPNHGLTGAYPGKLGAR